MGLKLENERTMTNGETAAVVGCSESLVSDVKAREADECRLTEPDPARPRPRNAGSSGFVRLPDHPYKAPGTRRPNAAARPPYRTHP